MERIQNGLYVLAIAIVASTLIFSYSMFSAANTMSTAITLNGKTVAAPLQAALSGANQPVNLATPTPGPSAPTAAPTAAPSGKIDLSGALWTGNANAKITLVEYTDFQCPYCGRHFTDTMPSITKDFIDTGKVKYVLKMFPLYSIHPNADPAANAYECVYHQTVDAAGQSQKAFDYHSLLFTNQGSLSDANYKTWAQQVGGINMTAFSSCVASKQYEPQIQAEEQQGIDNGIQGTPGFKILDAQGNVLDTISGALPYASFQAELNKFV